MRMSKFALFEIVYYYSNQKMSIGISLSESEKNLFGARMN